MAKTNYHIQLKGYVGGWDFDRSDVDAILAENDGKEVNVLIDSLGAAHISIDAGAMYLVHKCSMAFFEWGSLNSDQFAPYKPLRLQDFNLRPRFIVPSNLR